MKPIRNSAKAIIIQDGKLLCTKNRDQWGDFYLLPGGGQEPGETLNEALKRECMEEISAEVEPGDILYIREYIGKNHQFAKWDFDMHQIEFMFACTLLNEEAVKNGAMPDSMQIGLEWLEISRLSEYRIYPATLAEVLDQDGKSRGPVYLGDAK